MTALLERDQLYTNLSLLERLAQAAATTEEAEAPPLPSHLPGLTEQGKQFLHSDPRARGALATWFVVFKDTLELLRMFRAADLHRPASRNNSQEYLTELKSALEASRLALDAAAQRINHLAARARS